MKHECLSTHRNRETLSAIFRTHPGTICRSYPGTICRIRGRQRTPRLNPLGFYSPPLAAIKNCSLRDTPSACGGVVHSFHPDLKLILVGDGPDKEQIEALVNNLDLADSVILAGWQENIFAFMTRAKALVLCSRHEGWPNVLVEAMACGCPVIATDCQTGPREILSDNEYGLLVPVDDPEALARSVEKLLTDESLKTHFQAQSRLRAQDFDLEQIGPKYVRLLQNIAETAA